MGLAVDQLFENCSEEVKRMASGVDSYKRSQYRRFKIELGPIEKLPKAGLLANWTVPEELSYFVLHDSIVNQGATPRWLAVGTMEHLTKFSDSEDIYSDGFHKVPKGFEQVG